MEEKLTSIEVKGHQAVKGWKLLHARASYNSTSLQHQEAMLAKGYPPALPALEECLEVTRIHNVAGLIEITSDYRKAFSFPSFPTPIGILGRHIHNQVKWLSPSWCPFPG